jgi:hypothetical protein
VVAPPTSHRGGNLPIVNIWIALNRIDATGSASPATFEGKAYEGSAEMTERKLREPRAWRVDFWCQDATPAQFIVTITDDASGIGLVNERTGQTPADVAGIVGKALKKFGVPGESVSTSTTNLLLANFAIFSVRRACC